MKTLAISVLLFASLNLFSQAIISPALSGVLSESKTDYVSLNIYFNSVNSIYDLAKDLDSRNAEFDERVKAVNNLLNENALISQNDFAPVLEALLSSDKSSVKEMRFYRSVNMLNIVIKTDLVYALAEKSFIKFLDINSPRYSVAPNNITATDAPKAVNGTEPGLKAVNAHKLWEMGYTGKNILFLSMDTGVFPQHPAISDNFAGNHFPLSQCWYGVRSEEPTDHASSSHGTHTTGTVLGLDQANNDTIGVAFNAMWIASDPVASSDSDLLDPTDFMNVFEWVLDPDGNPETTDDVPRVINNSWGYDFSLAIQFGACEMPEAEILVALEVAGICSPFSAGNDGPGASTNGFPAMRAFNLVNPMSIGAVNASNVIASFSSRGPTPCITEEGALQIKPEVVAPGVNVRSCAGIDSYANLQGTSMACPHVSGVLILLAEAFPMASAYELKYAVYETAIDLGDAGEDNVYGRGMIDALAAYNYLAQTYTPVSPVTNQYDLKSELVSPGEAFLCPDESLIPVNVRVTNSGETEIVDFSIRIYLNDILICDSLIETTLAPLAFFDFEYNDVQLVEGKNYIHTRVVPVEDVDEYDLYNNAINRKIFVLGETGFPYSQNFDLVAEDLSGSEFMILNPDFKSTWTVLSWGDADQYKAAGVNFNQYGSRMWEEDFAYLPQIAVPDDDSVFLVFTYAYKNRLVHYYKDSLIVEASTDCGINFTDILFANAGQNLATVSGDAMSTVYKPVSVEEFDTVLISLDQYRGQDVVYRFKTKNDRGSVLYIDEIKVEDLSQNSSVEDDFATQVEIFPNPANDFIILKVGVDYEILSICDITGRSLKTMKLNYGENLINLSEFTPGMYLMNFSKSGIVKKFTVSR
jgi:bacillopeptidase F